MSKAANEDNISINELAARYTNAYFEDIERLSIEKPDIAPKATDHIDDMINLIQLLIDNGHAYVIEGDVYFEVNKSKGYGKLSGKNIDELHSGARVEVDERK